MLALSLLLVLLALLGVYGGEGPSIHGDAAGTLHLVSEANRSVLVNRFDALEVLAVLGAKEAEISALVSQIKQRESDVDALRSALSTLQTFPIGVYNQIFVLGEFWGEGSLTSVERFNGRQWADVAPMRIQRYAHASSVYRGAIYVMGGKLVNGTSVGICEVFDGISWASCPGLSWSRAWHTLTVLGDRLYAVGGENTDDIAINSVDFFDGVSWTSGPILPHRRSVHATVAFNGRLIVIGGRIFNTQVTSASVVAFDGTAWTSAANLTVGRSSHSAVVHRGLIYVAGGVGVENSNLLTSVEVSNADVTAWSLSVPLATTRESHCLISYMGNLYAIGGNLGVAPHNSNTVVMLGGSNSSWVSVASMNTPRSNPGCLVFSFGRLF